LNVIASFFGGIFIGAILDFLVHLLDNDHHDQGFGAPPPNDSSQINDVPFIFFPPFLSSLLSFNFQPNFYRVTFNKNLVVI